MILKEIPTTKTITKINFGWFFYFCNTSKSDLLTCVELKKPETFVSGFLLRRKRYSHRIYYFTDYQLVVVVHDASTSQVAKCFLAGRPLMPKSLLQRFKFRKNPEPKQQIFDLFSFVKINNSNLLAFRKNIRIYP